MEINLIPILPQTQKTEVVTKAGKVGRSEEGEMGGKERGRAGRWEGRNVGGE